MTVPITDVTDTPPVSDGDPLEHVPAAELLRRVRDGQLPGSQMSAPARRRVVELLDQRGETTGEIAHVLGVTERTLRRDREAIRSELALPPHGDLNDQLMGEYYRETIGSLQRLRRLACSEDTSAAVRVWAEDAIGRIYHRFLDAARRLRHLPLSQPRLFGYDEADLLRDLKNNVPVEVMMQGRSERDQAHIVTMLTRLAHAQPLPDTGA